MLITCLPVPRYDETLYSFAARTRLTNAARDDREACQSLFGPSLHMRIADFPVNLEHFCQATKGALGGPAAVQEAMTIAGFYDRVGGHPWHAGSAKSAVATGGYGLAILSNGNRYTWRVCEKCIQADVSSGAVAYWHRSHQLPISFFCLEHNMELGMSSGPRTERQNRFCLPQDTVCITSDVCTTPFKDYEKRWRLTKLGVDALLHHGPAIDLKVIYAAMLRALSSRGLVTGGGSIRLEPFVKTLLRDYGFLSQYGEFADVVSPRGLDILYRSMRCENLWRRPVHNLILIDWLFGPWRSFIEQCEWQSVIDRPTEIDYRQPGDRNVKLLDWQPRDAANVEVMRAEHRKRCLEFMELDANANRSRFARANPKSFRWLLNNDAAWFNYTCPLNKSNKVQLDLI